MCLMLYFSSGINDGLSKKDELYNSLVEWMEERRLMFNDPENAKYTTQVQ